MVKNLMLWAVYLLFVVAAFVCNQHDQMFEFAGPVGVVKAVVWAAYLAFLVYSYYCSVRENIFRTVDQILKLHWGRQISLDLYIGIALFMGLIYLHEGSLLVVALWLLPLLLFANLATFPYLLIHFESIVGHFVN